MQFIIQLNIQTNFKREMNVNIDPDQHLLSSSLITSHTLCFPLPSLFIFTQSPLRSGSSQLHLPHLPLAFCPPHSEAARGTCRKGEVLIGNGAMSHPPHTFFSRGQFVHSSSFSSSSVDHQYCALRGSISILVPSWVQPQRKEPLMRHPEEEVLTSSSSS